MKKKSVIAILVALVIIASGLTVASVVTAQEDYTWSFVTIPGLPSGATLGKLWTDQPGNLYVWAERITPGTTDVPEAFLYHWDGRTWSQVLHLPAHGSSGVSRTGPSDVFASAYSVVDRKAKMYHYDGNTWTQQELPAGLGESGVSAPVGERGNVYAIGGPFILRFDGTTWRIVYENAGGTIVYISSNEIYAVTCWGHFLWDGSTWRWFPSFDFCDVWDVWGMRGAEGVLHLYAAGNNNFSNGVRVWRFTETYPGSMIGSWGSKYGTVFSDPPGFGYYEAGSAYGIWGSGPNDIYVVGRRGAWNDPTSGRVYHYNGTTWEQITAFGDIPPASDVWGSGPNNVWVSISDWLLHYGRRVIEMPVDIKPQSCPNPLNVNAKGVLPVAILGTDDFDVNQVDLTTVKLEGVSPLRSDLEDVATPFVPFVDKEEATDCTTAGADGFRDLTLKFDNKAMVSALGPVTDGEVRVLILTGNLLDGTPIVGEDVVVIIKKGKN